ncbi:MAG: PRC-barrel domain-containing protein [Anaerolineales bacterium]|jgi:sporulation protein YlmC with PRC-barrel domain
MKKIDHVWVLLCVVALLTAACSQNGNSGETTVAGEGSPTPKITATIFAILATPTPTVQLSSPTPQDEGGIPDSARSNPVRLSRILDYEVENRNGDTLGSVQNAIVELESGRIRYLSVAAGGVLGIGERTILVPWQALNIQESAGLGARDAFVTKVDQQALENAPVFDPGSETALQSAGWDQVYNQYWEKLVDAVSVGGISATVTPEPGEAPQSAVMRRVLYASDLLDYSILDGDQKTVGRVTEVILDRKDGHFYYFVVAAGGVLGVGEKWIPVPLRIMQLGDQDKSFQLRVETQKLVQAPNYDLSNLPDFSDPGWDKEIEQYWEKVH